MIGENERGGPAASDRYVVTPPKPARRTSRKPKRSPFERCMRKLDEAFNELDAAMRELPGYDPAANTWGHWEQVQGLKYERGAVWVRGPWVLLHDADKIAALMDGIRECVRG